MRSRLTARLTRVALAAAVSTAALTGIGAATATAASGGAAAHDEVGQFCGTNDLTFTLDEETQAGGYYLITAKAKPGITCYLQGIYPTASFGSTPETRVGPAEQSTSEEIKLSGDTVAYSGISPKSVGGNEGTDSDRLTLAITNFEVEPVTFTLPGTVSVNEPIATNWHADAADAVPFPN
ncbi:DUF4232 domain-containing protein [Streptomyces sp. NPDC050560]|uniref:DUF4232 domain-containing protein n=1 Tax=Streptomyces sp. NPDC050560 TaxID=3365630 RepID=UPI0037A95746